MGGQIGLQRNEIALHGGKRRPRHALPAAERPAHRGRAFVLAAQIACAVGAGVFISAPHSHPPPPPAPSVAEHATARPHQAAANPAAPQHNAAKESVVGAVPPPVGAPQTTAVPVQPAPPPPRPDVSVDVQDLPVEHDDPILEAALSDLDKQADLDESLRRLPGPPVAPASGQPPNPPSR